MSPGDRWLILTGARCPTGQAIARGWRALPGGRVLGISRQPDLPGVDAVLVGDLRQPAAVADRLAEWLTGLPHGPAALVHAAGLVYADAALATTADEWEQTLAVNLRAALTVARPVVARMAGGGAIVLVSSVDAVRVPRSGPDAAYAAAKAGLEALGRHAAVEWGPRAIRVNTVRLGPLEEGGMGGGASLRAGLGALTADGGLVTAEEAAAAVLFLLSDRASGITGQTLVVDHGFGLAY